MRTTIILLSFFLSSCAVYHKDYRPDIKEWNTSNISESDVTHRMFLIGDAGKGDGLQTQNVLAALTKRLDAAGDQGSVIFLGDNIYPEGFPKKDEDGHEEAMASLDIQIKAVKNFEGKTVFLAGNHDWYSGLGGLKRQQKYIEKKLDSKKIFRPDAGCGGPDVIKVNDDVVIIAMDSYWYKFNWDREPEINEGCPIKTRAAFLLAFEDALKKNKDKTIIVALHHPPLTSGYHGGNFSFMDHLFSLKAANDKLLLPLPILYTGLRRHIGITEDNSNVMLRSLHEALRLRSKNYKNVFYVSGHEHNLQYAQVGNERFIVSGSGSKRTPAKTGGPFEFTYAQGGFVELVFGSKGDVEMVYHALEKESSPVTEEMYRKYFEAEQQDVGDYDFSIYNDPNPNYTTSIYDGKLKSGALHNALWGDLHRDLYYKEMEYTKMDLSTHLGGLEVVKKGGGMQTNSLRLEAKDGKQYVMKSLRKDVSRLFFGTFANSFAQGVMEDFYTWTHPFAINMITPLSKAANVYHTNARLVYIPKQPALGVYNAEFGNEVYLFEERPDGNWEDLASFGNSKKIDGTFDLIEDRLRKYDKDIDTEWVLRSRLFDMLIGDFDRHFDQWRWAEVKNDAGEKVLRPIPRDRDQAFVNLDGPMPALVKMLAPSFRTFQSYGKEPQNSRWFEFNAFAFDRFFLRNASWEDWEKQINYLSNNITDEVIEHSVSQLPSIAQNEKGLDYVELLKSRRNNLPKIARKIYDLLNKRIEIIGTEKDDRIEVIINGEGDAHITVEQDRKAKKKKRIKYTRTIKSDETKLIVIYGLDGRDEFKVTGPKSDNVRIILVGGTDRDEFEINQKGKKAVHIYDDLKKDKVNIVEGGKDKRTNIKLRNTYDYKEKPFTLSVLTPSFLFNADDKLAIGIDYSISIPRFKVKPFGQTHRIKALYSPANEGGLLEYEGTWHETFGKWDLGLKGRYQTPRYAVNFFGYGNESVKLSDDRIFHQVRLENLSASTYLKQTISEGLILGFHASYNRWAPEQSENRFINAEPATIGLDPTDLNSQQYFGTGGELNYNNANHPVFPSIGMDFKIGASWNKEFSSSDNFLDFHTHLAIYQNINRSRSLVWAFKVQYDRIGDGYSFYQSATLGGQSSLRAFRRDRFRGDRAFSFQNDVRWNFGKIPSKLFPLKMGLSAGFDVGRVWLEDEDSDTWHPSYGGALWFEIFGLAGVNVGYYTNGSNDSQVLVGLGFDF